MTEQSTIKWATYAGVDEARTMKQHAFHSVTQKQRFTGTEFNIAQSLCGKVHVGEGDTLPETVSLEDIDAEVLNPLTACKSCLKKYNTQTHNNG